MRPEHPTLNTNRQKQHDRAKTRSICWESLLIRTQEILDHLEKFTALEALARLGSFHKASRELNISQPSLSMKVKNLEALLGITLLTRSSKGVLLTEDGHTVLVFVQDIIRSAENLRANLAALPGELSGTVRLGIYDSVARYFWPPFFQSFSRAFPGVVTQLTTGRSHVLVEKLRNREIDLAITVETPLDTRLLTEDLYTDTFSFYGKESWLRSGFKGKKGQSLYKLDASDIHKLPLISFSEALAENGRPLEQEIYRFGINDSRVHIVESFEIALEFCLQGIGLTVLPNRVASVQYKNKKLAKVQIKDLKTINFSKHRICLSSHRDDRHQAVLSEVIRQVKAFI